MTDLQLIDQVSHKMSVEWTIEHESIFVEWADKAMCYRWLHSKSHAKFSSLNAWYTIPVIIISTLTGTANFAQDRVPRFYQAYFAMLIGGFNLLAGIITTIQQFLKVTQLNEGHRVASIAWDKFYRNIKIELAKHPDERMDVTQLIKISKEEFDRLIETSPTIPDDIILLFKYEFQRNVSNPAIIKPEICDSLVSTELARNPWATDDNKKKRINQAIMQERRNCELISTFKQTFHNLHYREPLDSEIIDNLKDKVDVAIIEKTLETLRKTPSDIV